MPRYADKLLADGEQVIMRARQHWLATLLDGRYAWALLVVSLVVLVLQTNLREGAAKDLVGWLVLGGFLIALAYLAKVYISWWNQDYIITNRRVIKVEGIINKNSSDSSLEKINDAQLHQNLFGRMLDYGDLEILTAADAANDHYSMLARAPQFKRTMLNEKHELEGEFSRPMPTPPLRSPGAAVAGGQVPMQSAAMAAATPPTGTPVATSSARSMSADEVTRTLASLADLRDRGAISAEEYEAKKADLLSRL